MALKRKWIALIFTICYFFVAISEEPEFVEQIENATVPVGRNVKLSCSVRNLGSFKVSRPLN